MKPTTVYRNTFQRKLGFTQCPIIGTRGYFTGAQDVKMVQFNRHASAYEARRKITYPENLYQYLSATCYAHDAALDIGCGNGVSSARLERYFKIVEGVDMGANLISNAISAHPDIKFTVCNAEEFRSSRKYNLITCATCFYWMKREQVLVNVKDMLTQNGVFCAYKYDFPRVYGKLGEYISRELHTKWHQYRDIRLTQYDDTYELMQQSDIFRVVDKFVEPNTIELTPDEIAGFFLSTSYVTKYMDQSGNKDYQDAFVDGCRAATSSSSLKVNFDIDVYIGIGIKSCGA